MALVLSGLSPMTRTEATIPVAEALPGDVNPTVADVDMLTALGVVTDGGLNVSGGGSGVDEAWMLVFGEKG